MSRPETIVKIAFDLAAAGRGDFLTLDDPVRGLLGGGTAVSYPLAGEILENVTEYVRQVSIRRGRSNELERFQTGAASVVLDNRLRYFDPTAGTAISPYAPSILPRKELVIEVSNQREFTGFVEDWDIQYDVSGDAIAVAKAADGFALLAQQTIDPHTTVSQKTGERVAAILARPEIDWLAARQNIDTGLATLMADAIGGTVDPAPVNALGYLQNVEADEPGALFIAKNGVLTFRQRSDLQQVTSVKFADDGTGIPFVDIQLQYGTEQMRNRVSIARLNAGTVTAVDTASEEAYGIIDYSRSGSLLNTDAQAQALADWLVNLYGQPQLRITNVTVLLNGLTASQVNEILSVDLGDALQVVYTPNGIGDPIDRFVAVDSIEHDINVSEHRVTFGLSQTIGAFTLDSTTFGILDTNVLGF